MKNTDTGFTLAEVLITLTIIGIIASIAIPGIISDINDQQLIATAKKQYAILNQALMLYKANNGGSLTGLFPPDKDSNYSIEELSKYLKINKKCTTSQLCWSEKTKYLNQINNGNGNYVSGEGNISSGKASGILADGARIAVTNNGANITKSVICDYVRDANGNYVVDVNGNKTPIYCNFSEYGRIYIDVNGAKGPNRFGQDTWAFRLYENKISGCGWSSYTGCLETTLKTDKLVIPTRY